MFQESRQVAFEFDLFPNRFHFRPDARVFFDAFLPPSLPTWLAPLPVAFPPPFSSFPQSVDLNASLSFWSSHGTGKVPRKVLEADIDSLISGQVLPYEGYDAFEDEDHFVKF